jgi:peptidoglycan/LPS O-acetylase OafA/YrhL
VTETSDQGRFAALDGLRGIAISWVVLYHAFSRWPEIYTYGDLYAHNELFRTGKVGVQLFFLISGFVIFMTLDRSKNMGEFLWRRWLRLWPAMFAVSTLLFATAPLFFRPSGTPTLRDLLPGLTLIEPDWWAALIGSPQNYLEGSFWSLYVEVKFYLVVGVLYFVAGSRIAIGALVAAFLAPKFAGALIPSIAPTVYGAANLLGSWHWGWFAAGALFYKGQSARWLMIPATCLALLAASGLEQGLRVAGVVAVALFASSMLSRHVQAFCSQRIFLFLGAVSYPLYLVHENTMVGLIRDLGMLAPSIPALLLPVLPTLFVIGIAWILTVYVEPVVRQFLKQLPHFTSKTVRQG